MSTASGDLERTEGREITLSTPTLDAPRDARNGEANEVANSIAVEATLAAAIEAATAAQKWDLVAQLARELEARRLARTSSNVVALPLRKRGA